MFGSLRIQRVLLYAGLCAAAVQPGLRGATILSENFDALTQQLAVTSAGAFTAINGTNIDIVGGGSFCVSPESGNCVDLNGSGGNPQGQLQSNMVFTAGNYLLSFNLIGDQRGSTASATVTFGNYSQTFTLASGDVTTGIVSNVPVTLATAGNLLFASNIGGNVGLLLDNVVVSTPGGSSVPEPSPVVPVLTGLLILTAWLRYRRQET